MSNTNTQTLVTYTVAFVTVLFSIIEVLIAGGYMPVQQGTGFLSNLTAGGVKWYLNPIVWVIVITIIVNAYGFVENYVILKQPYDVKKFAETFLKYTPMIVFFSQVPWANFIPGIAAADVAATNIGITSAISVAIDILTRMSKSVGNTIAAALTATISGSATTTPQQQSTGIPAPPTPSTIPPIPSVPATLLKSGKHSVSAVTVDGKPYTSVTALHPGEYTVQYDPLKDETTIAISFPDYISHQVSITLDTGPWTGTLKSGADINL